MLSENLEKTPHLISSSKWGKYLPEKYKVSLIKQKLYDFDGAFHFINSTKLLLNASE